MKKVLTAAVAALTIVTAVAAATSDANAKKWGKWGGGWGWKHGIGLGIAAGVLGAAAYATYAPACEWVPMYDRFGNFRGYRRACAYY